MTRRVCSSKIDYDMVRHMPTNERKEMFNQLDCAVEAIYNDYAWKDEK